MSQMSELQTKIEEGEILSPEESRFLTGLEIETKLRALLADRSFVQEFLNLMGEFYIGLLDPFSFDNPKVRKLICETYEDFLRLEHLKETKQ